MLRSGPALVRLALALLAFVMAGCSAPEDLHVVDDEVKRFHDMFNANEYEIMYVNAADHLQAHTRKNIFVSTIDSWYREFGPVRKSKRTAWTVEANTSDGTLVTVKYHTEFANGPADEEFTYQLHFHSAMLGHYMVHGEHPHAPSVR